MTVMELMAEIEKAAVERQSDLLNKVRLMDAKQGRVEKPDGTAPMPPLQICTVMPIQERVDTGKSDRYSHDIKEVRTQEIYSIVES